MSDNKTANDAPLRTGLETVIAILLAGLGIWHIWNVKEPDSWTGFALIGIALLFYLLRGQIITKLAVTKGGIEAELKVLEKKVEATAEDAEVARKDAAVAKGVATQFAGPKSSPDTSGSERESIAADRRSAGPAALEASDAWAHPTLQRGPKVPDDPQKNQWGGEAVRNGRQLDAEVVPVDDDWYEVTLTVSALPDAPPLINRVRFHLHDTFRKSVVTVRPKNGVAKLERYAWGAFTVGAEVENEPETYLELDMAADDFDAPKSFKER